MICGSKFNKNGVCKCDLNMHIILIASAFTIGRALTSISFISGNT